MKQFYLYAAMLLILCIFLAPASAQSVDIVVLLPDNATSSSRWEVDDRRFLDEAFQETGVSYRIVNAEADAATQMVQAEQAIGDGAKVLLMVNLSSAEGAQIIEMAHSQGVIVIDYDRMTVEGSGADYYVSF